MRRVAVVVPVLLVGLVLAGCPQFPSACDYGGCGDGGLADGATLPGEGGVDGGVDAPPPPGCDTVTDPTKNPEKCLVDGFGVYV